MWIIDLPRFLTGASLVLGSIAHVCAESGAPVTVAAVTRGGMQDVVEMSGTVTAERRSSLSARTAGLVSNVRVDAGSRVKEGEVLIALDDALANLALERAREALKESESELTELKRLNEEGQKLVKSGGIPKTEAEARQSALGVKVGAVKQLEVNVREQAEIVNRHRVLAPYAGVISAKLTEVGEWVETGVPVLDLVEVDAVRFDVQVPQERFTELALDTPTMVKLDSLPTKEFSAKILTKVPVKDPVARTFLLRLTVDAPPNVMSPGVSGRAIFQIQNPGDVLTIPRDATVRQPDGGVTAWVVNDDPEAPSVRSQVIRIGKTLSGRVEILEGLKEGQQVVLRGNETLREGQAIQILKNPSSE